MSKIEINPGVAPFPKPIVLVGAMVNGRPNFITIAWFNRLNRRPNIWGVAMGKRQYTLEGIRKNGKFSINFPNVDIVARVDFCGIYSGREVDKSETFDVFYGELGDVPMVKECPVTAECSVYEIIELPSTSLLLGEVKHAYIEERFMTDGTPDLRKINPFVFIRPGDQYWALGDSIGDAWSIGKKQEFPTLAAGVS
ncbi:MAG: flavin reductase family protein [Candidatus Thorarchaeota archaeon]